MSPDYPGEKTTKKNFIIELMSTHNISFQEGSLEIQRTYKQE